MSGDAFLARRMLGTRASDPRREPEKKDPLRPGFVEKWHASPGSRWRTLPLGFPARAARRAATRFLFSVTWGLPQRRVTPTKTAAHDINLHIRTSPIYRRPARGAGLCGALNLTGRADHAAPGATRFKHTKTRKFILASIILRGILRSALGRGMLRQAQGCHMGPAQWGAVPG